MNELNLWLLLAASVLFLVLAMTVLIAFRRYFAKSSSLRMVYRILISGLTASLCPTLLMAGHGAIPLPTFSGLISILTRTESIQDLRLSIISFGSNDAAILIFPFVVCFVFIYLVLSRRRYRLDP